MSSEPLLAKMDMSGDWTERFIRCVERRPALYNKHLDDHLDRDLVKDLWTEVCEQMLPEWSSLTNHEKNIRIKEIQYRWRNLRMCLKRELNKQKQEGEVPTKRRKYIYFDQLKFLLPILENRDAAGDDADGDEPEEDDENSILPHFTRPAVERPKKPLFYAESMLQILKDKIEEEIDDDKYFLLSLVPSFKTLTDDQKFEAKMEFLAILKRIKSSENMVS